MVQLNPAKWGAKSRQKKKDKLRIEEIKASLKRNTRSQGGAGIRRKALQKELASLGGKTDKQVEREKRIADRQDKQARRKYDQEHKKSDSRGRHKGYKEGYDPSKGMKGYGVSSTSKSKSKATMTGRERAQQMAKDRIAAKKAGTYKKPKTAQELATERLAKKNKKK